MLGWTLEELIQLYKKNEKKNIKKKELHYKELNSLFTKKYTKDVIQKLCLETYCFEHAKKDGKKTFCYDLNELLKDLPGLCEKTGVRYGIEYKEKQKAYKTKKGYLKKTPEGALELVKKHILEVIELGEKQDIDGLANHEMETLMKNRIVNTYFPNLYLPIIKKEHLDRLLCTLELRNDNISGFHKQEILKKWMKGYMPGFNLFSFVEFCFLYFNLTENMSDLDITVIRTTTEEVYRRSIAENIEKDVTDIQLKRPMKYYYNGGFYYMKDPEVAICALQRAFCKCERNRHHRTFIRRNTDISFTHAHHIIPVNQQNKFEQSLDIPENIVSLCCSCFGNIHEGKDAREILLGLYYERKELLEMQGLYITAKELLNMYGYTDDLRYKTYSERRRILEQDVRDCNYLSTIYDFAFDKANIPIYPFVGKNYRTAKSKVLIIGEAHYCTDSEEREILNAKTFTHRKNITRYIFKHWKYHEYLGVEKHNRGYHGEIENIVGDFENVAYYNISSEVVRRGQMVKVTVTMGMPYLFKVFEILQPDYILYFSKSGYYSTPKSMEGSKVRMINKDIDYIIPEARGSIYQIGNRQVPVIAFNQIKAMSDEEKEKVKQIVQKYIKF